MESFSEIISAFGGPAKFAAAIRLKAAHAGSMKARDSIPPEYWADCVAAAASLGIPGVTLERLAELAARQRIPQAVNQ